MPNGQNMKMFIWSKPNSQKSAHEQRPHRRRGATSIQKCAFGRSQMAKSWTASMVSSRTMLSKTPKTKRIRAPWAEVTTARVIQTCKMNCYSVLRRGSLSSNWMIASKYARNTSKYTKIRSIGKRRWRLFWKSIRKVDSQPYRELQIIRNVLVMMLLQVLIERIQIIKTIRHQWATWIKVLQASITRRARCTWARPLARHNIAKSSSIGTPSHPTREELPRTRSLRPWWIWVKT